jgi:NAD(P)-dependent dehydrogenase (short-subunit alcohol dehydrogenase family)
VAADYAGKTALITGAGRGIGRAVALGLGGAGAHVILLARTDLAGGKDRRHRGSGPRLAFEVNVVAPAALTGAVLPGMLEAGWGRIVNVSSGIVARPDGMVRGNACAATKAALEAHTVNLAA